MDFTSKIELDLFNSEENTNKSLLLNGKVRIIKNNSNKSSKQKKDEKKEINPNIEVKNKFSEICCSNKENNNCLVF